MKETKDEESQISDLNLDNLELDSKNLKALKEDQHMDESSEKTNLLSKLNLSITVVGLAVLGFLQFNNQASHSESMALMKREIKTEIQKSIASSQQAQFQAVLDKNAELELKVDGYSTQIGQIEMKLSQFQVDLDKNTDLRNKVAELQSLVKKGKTSVNTQSTKSAKATKSKVSSKPAKRKLK